MIVNGQKLTEKEIRAMLRMDEGLQLLKGQWVEISHQKLEDLLSRMKEQERDVTLREALAISAGLPGQRKNPQEEIAVENASWLNEMLVQLRQPSSIPEKKLPKSLHADLRPYQKEGVSWLQKLGAYGFGACLADDMGLGKTLQVLSYLEEIRNRNPQAKVLLIAPASLVGNWENEIRKFAPEMDYQILHGKSAAQLEDEMEEKFLNITTYGMSMRLESLQKQEWDILILDEAQAIKNPRTKQTRTVKNIHARQRIALTGTPVENDLVNLWSLFDFLDPGLLGTFGEFKRFAASLEKHPENYGRLKNMVAPFLLRRLKTDKTITKDLPDKTEKTEYIPLSKKQTALYRKEVERLEKKITESEGIERKGLVLSSLTKLKQICNHPDQFLGQHGFSLHESGKLERLKELCETISSRHECVLVFTQYREIMEDLDAVLHEYFGRPGLMIHGGTPVSKRTKLVEQFNAQDEYIPYMILSLKAAGTGLNLTAASHVIHFDRWWNPAVENQATDRAYRIGQTKNVVVHKFVCKGTLEEKIEELIESKKELAEKVVGQGQGTWLTEMSNDQLLSMLRLEGR